MTVCEDLPSSYQKIFFSHLGFVCVYCVFISSLSLSAEIHRNSSETDSGESEMVEGQGEMDLGSG